MELGSRSVPDHESVIDDGSAVDQDVTDPLSLGIETPRTAGEVFTHPFGTVADRVEIEDHGVCGVTVADAAATSQAVESGWDVAQLMDRVFDRYHAELPYPMSKYGR